MNQIRLLNSDEIECRVGTISENNANDSQRDRSCG